MSSSKTEFINNKLKPRLRPNENNTKIHSISSLLYKFLLIAILFIFIAYATFEYLDIYPFSSNITENFTSSSSKYIVEPKPQNLSSYPKLGTEVDSIFSNITDTENPTQTENHSAKEIDMNILASQRYYKSVSNSPDAIIAKQQGEDPAQTPKTDIASLRQEIPATYMISILNQVIQDNSGGVFTINTNRLPRFNSLLENVNNLTNNKINLTENVNTNTNINSGLVENKGNIVFIGYQDLKKYLDEEAYARLEKLFSILKLYLISLINIQLIKNGQSHKAHPFQFLRIINSELLGIEIILEEPSSINLVFNIITYRQFKTHSFNIQSRINCSIGDNINCKIIELELLGTTMQNDLPVSQLGMTKLVKGHLGNSIGSPISNQGITGNMEQKQNIPFEKMKEEWIKSNDLQNEKISSIAGKFNKSTYGLEGNEDISAEQIDVIAQKSAEKGYTPQLYGNYKCFGVYPDGNVATLNEIEDPVTCQSYIPEINSVGVWDSPCGKNEECPYYTETGEGVKYGCNVNDGKCVMPAGVVRIGYKQTSKYSDRL